GGGAPVADGSGSVVGAGGVAAAVRVASAAVALVAPSPGVGLAGRPRPPSHATPATSIAPASNNAIALRRRRARPPPGALRIDVRVTRSVSHARAAPRAAVARDARRGRATGAPHERICPLTRRRSPARSAARSPDRPAW